MAYIGKDPAQIKRALNEKDTFTGDGSTVAFDLTSDASSANEIQVFVDNIRQEPGASDAYTLGEDGSGNLRRITFTAAPDNGAEIYVLNPKTTDSNLIVPSDNSVTSSKIVDGTIVNADINASAAISDTKLGTISTACKVATSAISQPGSSGVYLAGDGNWGAIDTSAIDTNAFNISLLGFKMAVNEGLTVFNLVDGVVDEFNDESGTDEAEGSNDLYCASGDFYKNGTDPVSYSAGFTINSVTEPDTSSAGTNPAYGSGTVGTFTVPACLTSTTIFAWGAGGGSAGLVPTSRDGGGGGFSTGTLAVTPGQIFNVAVGEGGKSFPASSCTAGSVGAYMGGGRNANPDCNAAPVGTFGGEGGGLTGLLSNVACGNQPTDYSAPDVFFVGGSGGSASHDNDGGGGGGTTGFAAVNTGQASTAQTNASPLGGGGGDQEQGGQVSNGGCSNGGNGTSGTFLQGGDVFAPGPYSPQNNGGGGAGYYGGGAGVRGPSNADQSGGGGSSYVGHPQITCGSTTAASGTACNHLEGGGVSNPNYVASTNEGGGAAGTSGEDGYLLISGTVCGSTTSTTIVSEPFTSTSVPTSARIVVFEENVDTPTLNTDVIASISRDGGATFTNATLTDSGYVTGSSGQRILTGQATISGQPSGQSMRWKLALANNTVKIHGVSLQWA